MFKNHLSLKIAGLLVLSFSFIAFTGCSPKVKMGLWYKTHQDAALALGIWVANNPDNAATLLNLDCTDREKFKKKITDALNNTATEQPPQQTYDVRHHNYHYGAAPARVADDEGFKDWCRKYPAAAKKLRSHAKALCKTGLGVLNGSIDVYK